MIGCLRTRVRKQPIIAIYFEFENELMFLTSGPDPPSSNFRFYLATETGLNHDNLDVAGDSVIKPTCSATQTS